MSPCTEKNGTRGRKKEFDHYSSYLATFWSPFQALRSLFLSFFAKFEIPFTGIFSRQGESCLREFEGKSYEQFYCRELEGIPPAIKLRDFT